MIRRFRNDRGEIGPEYAPFMFIVVFCLVYFVLQVAGDEGEKTEPVTVEQVDEIAAIEAEFGIDIVGEPSISDTPGQASPVKIDRDGVETPCYVTISSSGARMVTCESPEGPVTLSKP